MKTVLTVVALLLAGAVLALALLAARNAYICRKKNRARRAAPREPRKWPKFEMTKLVSWVCLVNGIAWVWTSSYLVLAYCIKSAVENLSKNNRWPDKGPAQDDDEGGTA